MHRTPCPDLPPDLLREISGHIHIAADFVRFHAVCKAWRESHELATRKKMTGQFLTWLLAPKKKDDSLKFRCVFSKSSYRATAPKSGTGNNWVARSAVRYFTAGPTTLSDPLTRDVIQLPLFLDGQWEEGNPSGIIYNDDTVLLYTKYDSRDGDTAEFRAALLRPGEDEWTVVQRTLEFPCYGEFCVVYHAGKILVTVEDSLWHVVTTTPSTTSNSDDVLVPRPSSMPRQRDGYNYEHAYVLESRGELLWASVHIRTDYPDPKEYRKRVHGLVGALSVSVHVLEEAPDLRWVWKKGIGLADRVLFLGWPNSFAVDASRIAMSGGFAYFMYSHTKILLGCMCHQRGGVFRYNLMNNTMEFVEWLPQGWDHEMCTWFIPRPTIRPIH